MTFYCLLRGGSWLLYPRACRSASRALYQPDHTYYNVGFRVACPLPEQK